MAKILTLILLCTRMLCAYDIALPTDNNFIFLGQPEKFYMYVDRNFEGEHTQPWQGGSYGFVRTPIRKNDQVLQVKFHEGIDILPLKRDRNQNPLDMIRSIADGTVAYINPTAGKSNYGKYVVVLHRWENSDVYSLYAHLSDINCKVGDVVKKGTEIAKMGFTGEGINRTRSHLHLEIGLILSGKFDQWAPVATNPHGLYNGANLAGCDVSAFLIANKKNPSITIGEFLAQYPAYFKVTLPNTGVPEISTRYPWLIKTTNNTANPSWEISFSATGMPLAIYASNRTVPKPLVTSVRASSVEHKLKTRGLLTGENLNASLAPTGINLLNLLMGNFQATDKTKKEEGEGYEP